MKRVLIFLDLSVHAQRTKLLSEVAFTDKDLKENPELAHLGWSNVRESDPIVIIDVDETEYQMSFGQFKEYCKSRA